MSIFSSFPTISPSQAATDILDWAVLATLITHKIALIKTRAAHMLQSAPFQTKYNPISTIKETLLFHTALFHIITCLIICNVVMCI